MIRPTSEKQRFQIVIKNPSTDSNCRFEKSIKVDGFAPKAVAEKYRKDFVKNTTKYREPLINCMSSLGVFQSSGKRFFVSAFNERRFVPL